MSIYRGAGGSGDAVADSASEALLIRELAIEVQADADAAAASATTASTQATNAATSATNASNSASAASTSASNAATSASSASSSASAASTSATNAAASATTAATQATNASTSASAASTSATAAASSASTATTQATNASNSASAAATSATSASNSASAAATSATNAASSATAAAGSATSASSSASSASTSASNAATSATNAATSATDADLAKQGAEAAELNAQGYASTASTQASNAYTSAGNATTSETNAAASESAAATSASNAATSETNAGTSEYNASVSEYNAGVSETNAASSASAASTSATNAASSASAASTSASSASSSASTATTQASNAASSASAAATSATNASNSASAASTSASAASTSASNAATSATNAAASYDSFDDRYLGPKSSAPTVDNDGNTLLTGALYFNTVDNAMKVWSGSAWLDAYASLSGALLATNNLSDLANKATARTNLGVAIGTNVQAWDADLDTWATKTAPTGTVVGTSDTQTLTNKTLTTPTIDKITTSVANTSLGAGNASIMKNRIINGAMVIDQRNAGASVTPASDAYTLDRWVAGMSVGSKFSVQQVSTAPDGFVNSIKITSLATTSLGAGDYYTIEQPIEGYNIADLGFGTATAKTLTLSFWVQSSLTGTFGGCFRGASSTRSYPFTYTISSANTWEQKTVTFTGALNGTWLTTNGKGLSVIFGLGVGTTYSGTAGSWASSNYLSATGATSVVGTNGATFYITGVQLEVGTSATGFEYRQYQQELALCQRYGYKIPDTFLSYVFNPALLLTGLRLHPITMRATPALSGSATYTVNTGSAGTVAIADATTYGTQFYNPSSNWSTSPAAAVYMQGAFLTAEL